MCEILECAPNVEWPSEVQNDVCCCCFGSTHFRATHASVTFIDAANWLVVGAECRNSIEIVGNLHTTPVRLGVCFNKSKWFGCLFLIFCCCSISHAWSLASKMPLLLQRWRFRQSAFHCFLNCFSVFVSPALLAQRFTVTSTGTFAACKQNFYM